MAGELFFIKCSTLRAPDDCAVCLQSPEDCNRASLPLHGYKPIGQDNLNLLGLNIGGCMLEMHTTWFNHYNLFGTFMHIVENDGRAVTFNGVRFDLPLILTTMSNTVPLSDEGVRIVKIVKEYFGSPENHCDLLDVMWRFDRRSDQDETHIDAHKDVIPTLWREGHVARVLNYIQGDLVRIKGLYEGMLYKTLPVRDQERKITKQKYPTPFGNEYFALY